MRRINPFMMGMANVVAAVMSVPGFHQQMNKPPATPQGRRGRRRGPKPSRLHHRRATTRTASVADYADEAGAARAMRRAARWLRANPDHRPQDVPTHIWEKMDLMRKTLA